MNVAAAKLIHGLNMLAMPSCTKWLRPVRGLLLEWETYEHHHGIHHFSAGSSVQYVRYQQLCGRDTLFQINRWKILVGWVASRGCKGDEREDTRFGRQYTSRSSIVSVCSLDNQGKEHFVRNRERI